MQRYQLAATRRKPECWPRWESDVIRMREFAIIHFTGETSFGTFPFPSPSSWLSCGLVDPSFFHFTYSKLSDYEL